MEDYPCYSAVFVDAVFEELVWNVEPNCLIVRESDDVVDDDMVCFFSFDYFL